MDLLQDILDNNFNEPKPQRKHLVDGPTRKKEVPNPPVHNLKRAIKAEVEPVTSEIPTNIRAPRYSLKAPLVSKEPVILYDDSAADVYIYQIPKIKIPIPEEKPEVEKQEVPDRPYRVPTFNLKMPERIEDRELVFKLEFKLPHISISYPEVAAKEEEHVIPVYSKYKLPKFKETINLERLIYKTPTRSDLAVLFVFFDYTGSTRILINYLYMIEKMKLANIPVFTMELVIHGKRPKISDAFHVYASSYLFQKEHLIRLLEKKVPDTFTKLVCLDADLIYTNPDWYDMLSETLDTCNIVQPFSYAHWLDITYKNIEKSALACTYLKNKTHGFWSNKTREYHPGFGWAFTRDWYQASGFYDLSIVGCGDSIFAYTISKLEFITEKTKLYRKTRDEWASKISDITIGFLDIEIYHLFHGPLTKRQYMSRDEPFEHIEDVASIIEYNEDGVIELTNPELNQAMLDMWLRRDDDGI
jgi:hypothetical protein